MRMYRCFVRFQSDEYDHMKKTSAMWYTRKTDKAKTERAVKKDPAFEAYTVKKVIHKEFDVPTNKTGMLEFLNKYCNR